MVGGVPELSVVEMGVQIRKRERLQDRVRQI